MPKAGDIALGFNVLGLINLALDPFSGNKNSQVGVNEYTSNTANQITGKYYLTAHSAIRVTLGYNTLSGSIYNPVQSAVALYNAEQSGTPDALEAANTVKVNDELDYAKSNILVMAGYERRRGYGRLQGFYGASLGFGFLKDNSSILYGNAFSNQYQSQYTTSFSSFSTATMNPLGAGATTRNLDTNYSAVITIGVRLFIGVEYFVFPKISVGAEFGWGYSYSFGQGYTTTTETYFNGQTGPQDVIQTTNSGRQTTMRGFSVDNNNGGPGYAVSNSLGSTALTGASGAITVLFHF